MTRLDINPRYQERLVALGLDTAASLLALPGPIISGHPDRNVARVTLGSGPDAIPAFLKREHRVRWRTRWTNSWDGFGKVSRSVREAQLLRRVTDAGVGCPEWIASGEDASGRAFLLVAELEGAQRLRHYLAERGPLSRVERYEFARRLGVALAQVHRAGVDHPDLLAKHVLVRLADQRIGFLDWQRSRIWPEVSQARRQHDLAVLDATLPEQHFTGVERQVCMQGYLSESGWPARPAEARAWYAAVHTRARRMHHKRRIQAERGASHPVGAKSIYWLDGESLCVTSDLLQELSAVKTQWVDQLRTEIWAGDAAGPRTVTLPGERQALLVTARANCLIPWLWAQVCGKPLLAAEVRQAGQIFRRQLQGEKGPRLLAFGQRSPAPWTTESFLLTEADAQATGSST